MLAERHIFASIRAPLLIPFGIPTQVFFSDTMRQKRQPAGEAGSLASLNKYFANLPLPAGRRSSWEKVQVGNQNGVIRGAHNSKAPN